MTIRPVPDAYRNELQEPDAEVELESEAQHDPPLDDGPVRTEGAARAELVSRGDPTGADPTAALKAQLDPRLVPALDPQLAVILTARPTASAEDIATILSAAHTSATESYVARVTADCARIEAESKAAIAKAMAEARVIEAKARADADALEQQTRAEADAATAKAAAEAEATATRTRAARYVFALTIGALLVLSGSNPAGMLLLGAGVYDLAQNLVDRYLTGGSNGEG